MKYNDIITNGVVTRRILGLVDEILFISDADLESIAYFDVIGNVAAEYTVVPQGTNGGPGEVSEDPTVPTE